MGIYSGRHTISAREGRAFSDGEEILNMIKFEIKAEKIKVELPIVGRRTKSNKTVGIKYTGTITQYKKSSAFAKMIQEFKETGKDVYFDMQGVLEDPSSELGAERIVAIGCNIDSATLINIDIESDDVVKEEIPFTIEDVEIQQAI
ncbi:phage tail tube protein [Dethiothermospora halolimnae]|uniref:phage tail tube protein n=1 Tax=Dethiothermospora halolimnae TaxID=3114390 RepID=UPI003CCC2182